MSIKVENLKAQLAQFEQELEQAKSHVYRVDGAIQVVKQLIAEAEKPEDDTPKED